MVFSTWSRCFFIGKKIILAVGILLGLSMPLQADAQEYSRRIMAGDRLHISVLEQPDLARVYAVAGDGTIDFSFAGRISIAELTPQEAAQKLKVVLESKYFKEATVAISIAEFVEGDVLVTGAIQSPGVIGFRGDELITLVEAVIRCGGLSPDAAGDRVRILRWAPGGGMERVSIEVNVQAMLESMDFSQDQYLRPRDIIVVPTLGSEEGRSEFLALGEVRSPGFHPFVPGMDIIKAVSVIGGLGEFADWGGARILRTRHDGSYGVLPLDLSRLFSAADMSVNLKLQKGDIFFVPSTRNTVRAQIYLLGEVNQPGKVDITPGPNGTLARVLLAAGGMTDLGNGSKVRVLRMAPDGSKKTLYADVSKVLKTGAFEEDIPLQDGDVVVVPGKILGF